MKSSLGVLGLLLALLAGAERDAWADVPVDAACGAKVALAAADSPGLDQPIGVEMGSCLGASWCPGGSKGLCYAPDDPISLKLCGGGPKDGFCDGDSWCTTGREGVCYAPDDPISIEHCGKDCGFCEGTSWCTCGPDGVCYTPDHPLSIEHCGKDCGFCDGLSWCTCGPNGVCYTPDNPLSIEHCGKDCGFCDGLSWCTCGPNGVCYTPDNPISIEHCGKDCGFCDGLSWCTCGPNGVCYTPDHPLSIEHCAPKETCVGGSLCTDSVCYSPDDPRSLAVCACRLIDPACAVGFCDSGAFCSSTCMVCYEPDGPISQVLCGGAGIDRCCEVPAYAPNVTTGVGRTVVLSGYTTIPSAVIDIETYDSFTALGTTTAAAVPTNPGGADLLYAWTKTVTLSLADWPDGGVEGIHVKANGTLGNAAALEDVTCPAGLPWDSWYEVIHHCTSYADLTLQVADPVLMLVDADPVPPSPSPYLSFKATPAGDTAAYYANIGAGPGGNRETFDKWKCINGFANPANLACPNTGAPETTAYYFNQGDLGFGREMHCREVKGCEGADSCAGSGSTAQCGATLRIACYVSNHDSADNAIAHSGVPGAPEPGFPGGIAGGVLGGVLATVAMESILVLPTPGFCLSGLGTQPSDTVRFYVFGANPAAPAVQAAELDSEGAKPVPGICMSCHHGDYDGTTNRVTAASFLPFDTCSFTYAADPSYSLSAQYENFRKLNALVLDSNPSTGVQDLITGWYDPAGVHTPGAVANNGYVPADWVGNDREEVYLQVVKPYCRTCHIAQSAVGSDFVSYSGSFEPDNGSIDYYACTSHQMPHAERTLNNFFAGNARATLVSWLKSEGWSTHCE